MIDSRKRLYELLAMPFRFPAAELTGKFIDGSWGDELSGHLSILGSASSGDDPLRLDVSDEAFQVEFISLFEVGMGGAPCPLHSGYYSRDRMRDLEEVVRFYRFFDYEPNRTPDRFPDHLVFELEFMAHLVTRESAEADAIDSLRLAQRDFVTRHLAGWTPQLHKNIEERASIPFIKEAVRLTDLLIGEERDHLSAGVRQAIQNA